MKVFKWLGIILLMLIILYFAGPQPSPPQYDLELPAVPADGRSLESYIREQESKLKLKPDNEARIVWFNDSLKEKTDYAVVYLHGFSASQEEGDPAHLSFAKKFGCNLFLSRLAEHGIDSPEPMLDLTADKLWKSAQQALAIGRQIGRKVILMGTSTGGTLALKLAAEYPDISSLILLSPNIAINDSKAWMLNNHWGLQVARAVKGKYNTSKDTSTLYKKYWYNKYRMESTVELEELLESSMKASLFERVKQPVLLLYYYKDEEHQDGVVKVSAMKRMYRQLGTPTDLKREQALPGTGDHVIGSYIKSKDVNAVISACENFGEEILKLPTAD